MFLAMRVIALSVYRVLGMGFLRKAWIDFDIVWTAAIFIAAVVRWWCDSGSSPVRTCDFERGSHTCGRWRER
jgi:hypothetical protein